MIPTQPRPTPPAQHAPSPATAEPLLTYLLKGIATIFIVIASLVSLFIGGIFLEAIGPDNRGIIDTLLLATIALTLLLRNPRH